MLQNIREHTQGWIASIVGVILCVAFALWGVEYYLNFNDKDGYAAKVNGKKISMRQLDADYKRLSAHMAELLGPQSLSNPTLQKQLKAQALQNLMTQEVLIQSAQKSGYSVSPYWVTAMIKQMPEFKENNRFSADRFQQVLARMNYSKEEFISDMRQTYLLNQVASGIVGTAFALPSEVNSVVELAEQSRDFIYYRIPVAKYINTVKVDENQIKQYYEQHKSMFKSPEKIQIEYIELNADEMKKNIKVSEQEITDYYNTNYSSDGKNKGPTLDSVKPKIVQAIIQQKVEQGFSGLNDKLTDLAFTNPNTLKPAAQALGLNIKQSEFFAKEGGATPITKNPKIIQTAFSADIITNGSNSNPIEVSPGHMVVLRMKSHEVESVLPLDKVREKIVINLKRQSAIDKTLAEGKQIINVLNQTQDITKTFKQQKLAYVSKLHIARADRQTPQEILQTAFSLPYPNGKRSSITGVSLSNGDYVIVVLNAIHKKPAQEVAKQQKDNYQKRLVENNGRLEYNLYVASQMNHAKFKLKKLNDQPETIQDSN